MNTYPDTRGIGRFTGRVARLALLVIVAVFVASCGSGGGGAAARASKRREANDTRAGPGARDKPRGTSRLPTCSEWSFGSKDGR